MKITPVLDWHPPSESRQEANEPYRLGRQIDESRLNILNKEGNKQWTRKLWLYQGNAPACTGFMAGHGLGHGYRPWQLLDMHGHKMYAGAKLHDYWIGENYDGSSVQGVCEFLKNKAVLEAYWWIKTPKEFKIALKNWGPLNVGTIWKTGMMEPDKNNVVHATGSDEGGHAYSIGGIDLNRNLGRIDNSWEGWGRSGSAWIDLDELFDLIFRRRGECALFRKNKYDARKVANL